MPKLQAENDFTLYDWVARRTSYSPKLRVRFNEIAKTVAKKFNVGTNFAVIQAVSLDVMSKSEFVKYTSPLNSMLKNKIAIGAFGFLGPNARLIYGEDITDVGFRSHVDKYAILTIDGEIATVFYMSEED